ncbi:Protein CBR-MIG-10 [Dirofilaria immitis]|nr:Protein CBR-MIG-10 [Dirofilaria immitis]
MENRGFESMKKLEGAVTATQQIGQLAGGIPRAQQQPQGSLTAVPQRIIGSSSSSSSSIKPSTTTTAHIQQQHRIIDTTGEEGGGEEGGGARAMVRVRQRPHIPPKPQMDAVRYSMANVQVISLEQQLTAGGDQILLGLPTLPTTGLQSHSYTYHDNNFMHGSGGSSSGGAAISTDCPSPDRDSAFGDSSSTESRNNNRNCRNSAISCSDSCRGSLNTPSPTQQASPNQSSISSALDSSQLRHQHQQPQLQQQQQSTRPLTVNEIKAAKIREALEKMREADIKKIYVKFFIDDGSSTISLLIDERWTVAECIRRIATKLNVPLSEHHAVVEEYPELYIKRIYEDHEYLVENIMMWTLNSQNKLYFTRRLDKYSFLDRPEEFLVTQKTSIHWYMVHRHQAQNDM